MSIRIGDKILAGTYNAEDLLMSPSFSGVPTAPTASRGDSSKQVANTEYVQNELAAFTPPTVINLDNNSITKNADDEIQTVGVIERNKGELMCDWVGTLEEYTTQNIETEHPDWTCYITDDDESNEALIEGDNVSLLTNDVGYIGNKQITNCITEIPQDIKLEINDDILTLKAGTKVYSPNGKNEDGSNKYFEYIFNEDVVVSVGAPTDERHLFFMVTTDNTGHNPVVAVNGLNLFSGDVEPTATTQTAYWFDTENNYIKRTQDTGTTWGTVSETHLFTFPICIATFDTGVCKSIDQTFNGFGYIGSTAFALPGVKWLVPNGRNEDGTLRSMEFVTDYIVTRTITWNNSAGQELFIGKYFLNDGINFISTGSIGQYYQQEIEPSLIRYAIWFKPSENKIYRCDLDSNSNLIWKDCFPCYIGQWFTSATSPYTITKLITNHPYRAVDYNDFAIVKEQVATAVNYNNITNCITEIPQDIKLELNNGVLTLKAGSKVYNGNGLLLTKTSDSTSPNANYNGQVMILMPANGDNVILTAFNGGTVSTLPAIETSYKAYYNTSDGKCYMDAGYWLETSFPIAIGTSTTESWVSIDQVFNGFGYIGRTVFALPGIKGLVPNGRNADGRLKNIEIETTNVLTQTFGTEAATRYVYIGQDRIVGNISNYTYIQDTTPIAQAGNVYWINNETNYIKYTNTQGSNWNVVPYILCGNGLITDSTGKITAFRSPSSTFQSIDYNDKSEISGWSAPSSKYIDLTLGASGASYTAPANGWIMMQRLATSATKNISIRKFEAGQAWDLAWSHASNLNIFIQAPVMRGETFWIHYTAEGNTSTDRFRFYYAEGEI